MHIVARQLRPGPNSERSPWEKNLGPTKAAPDVHESSDFQVLILVYAFGLVEPGIDVRYLSPVWQPAIFTSFLGLDWSVYCWSLDFQSRSRLLASSLSQASSPYSSRSCGPVVIHCR